MATSQALSIVTIPSSGDLSASQYCFVDENASGQAALPTAGGAIVGILQNNDAKLAGDPCAVAFDGISQCKLGGTVTPGDVVKADASGRAVTALAADIAAGAGVGRCHQGGGINNIGAVTIGTIGVANTFVVGEETVTSGALSAYTEVSYLSVTGAQAFTLPNGKYNGQRKRIECSVAATTPVGTLTITTPFTGEQATYSFDTTTQAIELVWRTALGWHITRKQRAGVNAVAYVLGTTNVGADDLHFHINLSITGSVTGTLAAGNVPGERLYFFVTTAASTPKGIVTGSFQTKLGVNSASWGVSATEITSTGAYVGVEWTGSKWREVLPTAVAAFA